MSDTLLEFLSHRIHPTLLQLYLRTTSLIEHFERDDTFDLLEDILLDADNINAESLLDTIYSTYMDILRSIIKEYGITLDEFSDYGLNELYTLIATMLYLESHEEKRYIREVIDHESSSKEALIELLSFASMYDQVYFASFIKEVSPYLLTRIYSKSLETDFSSLELEEVIDEERADEKLYCVLRKFHQDPHFTHNFVFNLIKNQLGLRLPLQTYIKLFSDQLFFNERPIEEIGKDLALLCFISKGDPDRQKNLKSYLEPFYPSTLELTNILSKVKTYSSMIQQVKGKSHD